MYNRAEVVHKNFLEKVASQDLPVAYTMTTPEQAGLAPEEIVELFESQVLSRQLDLHARRLKNDGRCYYTIGSSGHEGNAALGKAFLYTDMAFLHYRSCAFFVQRSKQLSGSSPAYDLMLSLVASADDPIAGGRHKVFGSKPLFVPPQTSTIASHLPKAVGAGLSISRARDLKVDSEIVPNSLIYCSFGDASANHSTGIGAINSACWMSYQNIPMPLVFVCEDNGIGISVPTPRDWIAANFSQRPGLMYFSCDGLNICDTYKKAQKAINYARTRRKPVFLHMKTVRLMGHAGSDVESSYRNLKAIENTEYDDPLLHTARIILENNILSSQQILDIYNETDERLFQIGERVCKRPKLTKPSQVKASVDACTDKKLAPPVPSKEAFQQLLGREASKLEQPLHLAKSLSFCLHETLLRYKNTLVFGEDVAQKGGVYHVTEGLYKKFGVRRVFNSLLDETTILGSAIGLAHNGFVPIPEIQFLAYLHNAEDQLRGEAATLAFFSQGQFTNPMVIRIAGLAYQRGFGGHFHNDNSLAVLRDLPGVVIAVPSRGGDGVKMFRRCIRLAYEEGRVVVFVEPIALYMTRDLHEEGDKLWTDTYPELGEEIDLGAVGVEGSGEDLCLLTYGNGTFYSRQAVKDLEADGVNCRVVDLRWLAPLNWGNIKEAIGNSKKILIVEECRKTGSFAEQLTAGVLESVSQHIPIRTVAADDCFIPLGKAAAAGLPKKEEVLEAARAFLKGGAL